MQEYVVGEEHLRERTTTYSGPGSKFQTESLLNKSRL